MDSIIDKLIAEATDDGPVFPSSCDQFYRNLNWQRVECVGMSDDMTQVILRPWLSHTTYRVPFDTFYDNYTRNEHQH